MRLEVKVINTHVQFIDIDLEEDNIEELLSELDEDWCDETARWAPCCGEVYHDLLVSKTTDPLKRLIRGFRFLRSGLSKIDSDMNPNFESVNIVN